MSARTPYQYLPQFAKVAIERLDSASEYRNAAALDGFLDAYAKTYGPTPTPAERDSAHHIASRRLWNFKP